MQDRIKIGPYFTFGLTENLALDVYYQSAPTIAFDFNWEKLYLGLTHSTGVTFRYKQLASGIEFNFGNINYPDELFDSENAIDLKNLRFSVGFKF